MNTKLKSSLSLKSSLKELPIRKSASIDNLIDGGIKNIEDLLWLFPLRIHKIPKLSSLEEAKLGEIFWGDGIVVSAKIIPAFGRRGKGKLQLFNATLVLKDKFTNTYLNLKWFNIYPSQRKMISAYTEIQFLGEIQEFNGSLQIINPTINPSISSDHEFLKEYPTVNKVPGKYIEKLIETIPEEIWQTPPDPISHYIEKKNYLPNLMESFKALHGLSSTISKQQARDRIIYQDFLESALKVMLRKQNLKNQTAKIIDISSPDFEELFKFFPYQLTEDQSKVLLQIKEDLASGHPMMRLIQGDVGCGKTTVAIIASLICHANKGQVALMCPTETLAFQHFETISKIYKDTPYKVSFLVGSTKTKDKKSINEMLVNGEIDLIIGTHSLFQEKVAFKNLQLAIIDEQHKFGVEQRLKLINKGESTHTLLMTATPIPRTLQLAHYGDLDISSIKTMPMGRKGIQTRIVEKNNYEKYLSFLKTRIGLGEQAYIVVPAIEESETLAIKNVEEILLRYKKFFPEFRIASLHGQLKSEEKNSVITDFSNGTIQILISTSVIEVGINVINATVMSIYDPHRFGLSSLHQLRGRVGRGDHPGFCFLIVENEIGPETKERLKVIENNTDGFIIAEADLQNRGSGDLFGALQSGHVSEHRIGDIFKHFSLFQKANDDVKQMALENSLLLSEKLAQLSQDLKITSTI